MINTLAKTARHNNFYAGEITIDDFNTNKPNKKRINNYIEPDDFQAQCELKRLKNNITERINNGSMTLEELKETRLISNTNGRPTSFMTDDRWQNEFQLRKLFVTPSKQKNATLKGRYSKESGYWNEETMGTYHGITNFQGYCSFINDVLRNIRSGQVDYCYFIYQIETLLRFEFDRLRTRYCKSECLAGGYWEVWLE